MAFEQDAQILDELKETLDRVENSAQSGEEQFPKEPITDFSTDNLTYLDISAAILEQTENLFHATRECNRLDPEYLNMCKVLVSAVNHLGSAFITKTAMHVRHYPTDKVESLTAERLNRMISFNFQKCNAALTEMQQTSNKFDLNYFNMLLSFDSTMQRLRATQKRAYDMNLGLIPPHLAAETALSFTEIDDGKKYVNRYSKDTPFRNSPAYSIRRDAMEEAELQGPAAISSTGIEAQDKGPEADSQGTMAVSSSDTAEETVTDTDGGMKFAVDLNVIDTSDTNPLFGAQVASMLRENKQKAWVEILEHLQDPDYCAHNPDYVKIFVKYIKQMKPELLVPGGT